jgi:Tfp pilus assembly protein PilN
VRPINLIPVEQRRGAARGPGGGPSVGVYALLGGLGVAVVCVLAFVLLSNSITDKEDTLAGVQAEAQGQKQVADALRPYGQFADLQRARHQQIAQLSSNRFDWERALSQLALAIPRNVYLLSVSATGSPNVEVEGGSGGGLSNVRQKSNAPAFEMVGCTYSHHAVARMMIRMRNLDDVTEVNLSKSERKAETEGGTADAQASDDISDCIGSSRVTKFELLVQFGGAASDTAAPATGGVPGSSAAPTAAAQDAAATASTGGAE